MPAIIQGAPESSLLRTLAETHKYNYDYPEDMDLRPGSALHERIKAEVLSRARESYSVMNARHSTWKKIDRTLTAYVPLDVAEKEIKTNDERKPVSIVVPISYSVLDTLLSYWISAFLELPYFRYEGVGPEDTLGAIMLEKIIEAHCSRLKVGLQLYIMWRDALSYGIGVASPIWHKHIGLKSVMKEDEVGFLSSLLGKKSSGYVRSTEEAVLFEGNKLINIDPYKYLPDPTVPVHDVQAGGFTGWLDKENYYSLLEREGRDDTIFNVKYLKHLDGRSYILNEDSSGRQERYDVSTPFGDSTNLIDTIYMYIKLVPKDWKLGTKETPEDWLFRVSADAIVTGAQPVGLNHGMFPVAVSAPSFDGYSITPVSEIETTYGLQEAMDWLMSSHIANVRKSLHDMFVVDPSLINIHDLKKPGPSKFIRMRKTAWGLGSIDKAIKQLSIVDVTRQHISDIGIIIDVIQRVTGASDSLQGVMRHSSERKSATEARGARGGALTRLEKSARINSLQGMSDIAYMFAMHTQQLMSEEQYIKVSGRWEEVLRGEYGADISKVKVHPREILIDYDVVPKDGSVPSGEHADTWVNLLGLMANNEILSQDVDIVKVFKHVARLSGAKNVEDFIRKGGNMAATVKPDNEVAKEAQAGNLVPMGDL